MPTTAARTSRIAALAALFLAAAAYARFPAFPQNVFFPALPVATQEARTYGQHEFVLRDRTVHLRGGLWIQRFEYAATRGSDPRAALASIVEEMQAAGWEVLLRDEPRKPPLATLRHKRDGREVWAEVEVKDHAQVTWLEPGLPTARLTLAPPASEGLQSPGDFPFLAAFPGSRLLGSARDDAAGVWVKEYVLPDGVTRLEVATVFLDALKVAGWQVVSENTDRMREDPQIVACWVRDGLELWTRIEVRRGTYSVEASTKPLG